MLEGLIRWLVKFFLQMILWVFLLSINWDGKMLFLHLKSLLVDNAIIATVEDQGEILFGQIRDKLYSIQVDEKMKSKI
ncbi:MAG: hypothetical protein KA436_05565 [Oligoflexales bacterium]|nr:hypothetical protein [Oligoflexales bacterium]